MSHRAQLSPLTGPNELQYGLAVPFGPCGNSAQRAVERGLWADMPARSTPSTCDDAKRVIKLRASEQERAVAALLLRQMDPKEKGVSFKRNAKSLMLEDGGDVFHFDEGLRSDRDNVYHLIAQKGPENWDFEVYQKIF